MKIVSDAGPILTFARAGCLDILRRVAGELIIPAAVVEDIAGHGAGRAGAEEVQRGAWIKRGQVRDRSLMEQLSRKLDLGEREALALAKEMGAALLIDEREARREALRLGIDHFGSLRILKEAKDRGIIPEVRPILDKLISSGTYLSDTLYQEFLREMGEGEAPSQQ